MCGGQCAIGSTCISRVERAFLGFHDCNQEYCCRVWGGCGCTYVCVCVVCGCHQNGGKDIVLGDQRMYLSYERPFTYCMLQLTLLLSTKLQDKCACVHVYVITCVCVCGLTATVNSVCGQWRMLTFELSVPQAVDRVWTGRIMLMTVGPLTVTILTLLHLGGCVAHTHTHTHTQTPVLHPNERPPTSPFQTRGPI